MAKAKPRNLGKIRRLYLDDPGYIDVIRTPDGSKTRWFGGEIAKVHDHVVAPVVWMVNAGGLPFGLEWLSHCSDEDVWYVRRIDDDPREVPID